MPSSSMLEQAIVDANSLREAALKNAQSRILEQYAPQVKEALSQLLEQEEPPALEDPMAMDPAGGGDMSGGLLDVGAPAGGAPAPELVNQTNLGAQGGLKTSCPCKNDKEIVEITLDELNSTPEAGEEGEGDISGVPIMEDKTVSLDLDLIEESLFGEVGDPWQRPEDTNSFLPKRDKFGARMPEPTPDDESEITTIHRARKQEPLSPPDDGRDLLHDEDETDLMEGGKFHTFDNPWFVRAHKEWRNPESRIRANWIRTTIEKLKRKNSPILQDRKAVERLAFGTYLNSLENYQKDIPPPLPGAPRPTLEETIETVVNEALTVDVDEVRSGWTGTPHPQLHDVALAQSMDDKFQEKLKAMEKSSKQLQNENAKLKTNVQKLAETLKKVIGALEEANTVNARLLYGNKVLTNESLNTKQKKEHVAALEKATSMEEAKLIYETLQNAADSNATNRKEPKSLREAVQYNTPSTLSLMREKLNENKEESDPNFTRMQVLAGIRK